MRAVTITEVYRVELVTRVPFDETDPTIQYYNFLQACAIQQQFAKQAEFLGNSCNVDLVLDCNTQCLNDGHLLIEHSSRPALLAFVRQLHKLADKLGVTVLET
jgi:hypothetical protein